MSDAEDQRLVPLRVDWNIPPDFPVQHATNMVIQHTPHEFLISFFEIVPPFFLGSLEEQREQALQMGTVQAKCLARISVSSGRMSGFLKILQENYEDYLSQLEKGDLKDG